MKEKIAAVCFTILLSGCEDNWQQAEADAKAFAKNLPKTTGTVSCVHKDTDHDGYCACSIFTVDGVPFDVECGCEKYCVACSVGCKTAPMRFKGR